MDSQFSYSGSLDTIHHFYKTPYIDDTVYMEIIAVYLFSEPYYVYTYNSLWAEKEVFTVNMVIRNVTTTP
jgi:hypothetical protein